MSHTITLIPGDGIGPEVTKATVRAVEATGVNVIWETLLAGNAALEQGGSVMSSELLDSLRRNQVGMKGPVTTPIGEGFPSVNVSLRKELELYANYRPIRALPGLKTRFDDLHLDLVVFRENTESSPRMRTAASARATAANAASKPLVSSERASGTPGT
jgi:isocitrate dehydrogenase (NAD+)